MQKKISSINLYEFINNIENYDINAQVYFSDLEFSVNTMAIIKNNNFDFKDDSIMLFVYEISDIKDNVIMQLNGFDFEKFLIALKYYYLNDAFIEFG